MAETYDVAPLGPTDPAARMQVDLSIPNFVIQENYCGEAHDDTAESSEEYNITNYIKDDGVFNVKNVYVKALNGPGPEVEIHNEDVRRVSRDAKPWVTTSFFGPDCSIQEW